MLAAEQRLRDGDEFRRTVRSGRRAGGSTLVVHALEEVGSARVGFVVSKAVGNAVVRNRVKRRLRHAVREILAEQPFGGTLVVRALPAAAEMGSAELRAELSRCLQRARRPPTPSVPEAAPARTGAVS